MPLPTLLEKDIYEAIATETTLTNTERQLFSKWYTRATTADGDPDNTQCSGDAGRRVQYKLKQDYR